MTRTVAMTPFEPQGPLPDGTALLEASAGTGKTYAIAGLTARYVAEQRVPLADMLVVTFGRAATSEVRERVRDRLATGVDVLERGADTDDPYLTLLATADRGEVARRASRLRRALSDFDAATIVTTHQFCNRVLAGLGVSGGADQREAFAERSADLVDEAIVEVYLRDVAGDHDLAAALPYKDAVVVAKAAIGDPHATVVPRGANGSTPAELRARFARGVRAEVDRRKRSRLEMDYDDLLVRTRDALVDPVTGEATAARLRRRYSVVLVDEFQDTDPVQWQILRHAFHGHVPLVLIGDPKQAIYAFRGGDLHTYLDAAGAATSAHTLAVNWRADPSVVAGVRHLLRGAALGDPRITVHPVSAGLSEDRLAGATAPVRVRVLTCDDGACDRSGQLLKVDGARSVVARDTTAVAIDLLGPGYAYQGRRLLPRDVAVLVRTNPQADLVRDHLMRAGIPAVISGTRSVFATDAARSWVTLLRGLEEPHRAGLVHAAALTMMVGTPPDRLASADGGPVDGEGDAVTALMRQWRDAWTSRGVPALFEQIVEAGLMSRLLGTPDGERHLTDLRHVAEALHAAGMSERLGPTAQREWLARQVADAESRSGEVALERSRRLESDTDAVQVLTVHSAKGLEFPVVLVPFGWDRFVRRPDAVLLHDSDGNRLLDVGGRDGPDYDEHCRLAEAEDADEELRALYVAVTRAASHLVLWWAPTTNTSTAPVHRILFGIFGAGEVPARSVLVPSDRQVHAHLTKFARPGLLATERATPHGGTSWRATSDVPAVDGVARFDRTLDLAWRRLSYTGITAGLHHAGDGPGLTSEPEETGLTDEPADAEPLVPGGVPVADDEARLRSLVSRWADLPAGTSFGTLVHEVLEHCDTSVDDLAAHVRAVCEQQVSRRLTSATDPRVLADAVVASMGTPLGPLGHGRRLLDVPPRDRLAELGFELPLAGGDRARRERASVADLAGLLREHLAADDPLGAYPDVLAADGLGERSLGGYLVGSIDAVLRLRLGSGEPAYLVVDYKTNVVRTDNGVLSAWHYHPDRLAAVMMAAHYPLQAVLYSVGLHRFLRWRQPGYDPATHLGGVLYLFLRGMVGPDGLDERGRPCGVFSWRPSAALVTEASDLLAGGAS